MPPCPTLQTQRLILRPHRPDDLDACAALWSDARVVRHIGGVAQDRQTTWGRILRYAGMWSLLGYGMWAVEERASGAFLGDAGLLSAGRGIAALDGVPEAGWAFVPGAWGRGIAVEAMAAALGWADAHLDAPDLRCIIEPDNVASVAVAARLGFRRFGEAEIGGTPVELFERYRRAPDPQAAIASA